MFLLDGFNEITVERRRLIIELNHFIEKAKGVQIVITSRCDMRATQNWNQLNKCELIPLSALQIREYLNEKKMNMPNPKLMSLIRNPMMLTLYTATCDIEELQGDDDNYRFILDVCSGGELMANFIECQKIKIRTISEFEDDRLFQRFLVEHMLPALGFEMEDRGKYDFTRKEIVDVIDKWYPKFTDERFLERYPCYYKINGILILEHGIRAKKTIDALFDSLHLLVKEGEAYRFLHQNFRDFFAALHIKNCIMHFLDHSGSEGDDDILFMHKKPLSLYVKKMLGQLYGEHKNDMRFKDGKYYDEHKKRTYLDVLIDRSRGRTGTGFLVFNIIQIFIENNKDLSIYDFSNLEMEKIILNSVRIGRSKEKGGSQFSEVKLNEKNIFFMGHSEHVLSVAYSPDGRRILSGSWDKALKERDMDTGECIRTYIGHSHSVNSVAYSPDGRRILSGSDDQTVKEWDRETGECIRTYTGHSGSVHSIVYSPDGRRILSGSNDHSMKEWDRKTGKCIRTYTDHSNFVTSVAYSPDGKRILSGSDDYSVKEWDRETGECIRTYTGHSYFVHSVAYSPDGRRILSGSYDNSVKEWDRATGKCIRTYYNIFGVYIQGCDFMQADLSSLSDEDVYFLKFYGARLSEKNINRALRFQKKAKY